LNLSKLSPYEDFIGVGYYTEAPMAVEEDIEKGKRVVVSTSSEFGYENVLAYTNLSKEVRESEISIYHVVEGERVRINFSAFDLNENGLVDYVEWNVDHLSEQVYEIVIEIIKAEVMDANRSFVRDVYEEVKSLDNVWTEVSDGEYLRVTFESMLDNSRDITIFPRVISGSPRVEVYEVGGSELIVEFEVLNSGEYNKVYLTNLVGSQDVFDLRIVGGVVEIDHVIDPFQGNTFGLAVYGEGIQVIPRYADWDGLNFETEQSAPTITAGTINRVMVKSSTGRNETAVVIGDSQGDILLGVRNNTNEVFSSWLDVASIGTTNDNFRGFYVDVEQSSGDFLVVYEKDITADRTLYYRTWNGTGSWSGEGTITLNGSVVAEAQLFVVMSSKPNSDEIMMASAGGSDDITAVRWNGTSWVNVTAITTFAAAIDEERFSLAWESVSGDAMIVWGEGGSAGLDNDVVYRIFSNSIKSWGAMTLIQDRAAVVQQVQICSDPMSDYIGAIIGPDSTGDVLAVMWDGNSWLSGEPGEEGAAENVVMLNAFCQWTSNTNTALFGYVVSNALNINYFQYDLASGTWTCSENGQTVSDLDNLEGSNGPCNSQDGTAGVMSDDIEVLRAVGDPDSSDIMVWGIDLAEDLEFFIFNGTHLDQPATNLLEATTTTVAANEPGWFDYFRFILRVYPQFSGYWDNNGTIFNFGIGVFNVSVVNSNGTVLLEINGTNYSAVNVGGDVYSVNVALTTGKHSYRWHSWGNGQSKDYNVSSTRNYTVLYSGIPSISGIQTISAQTPTELGVKNIVFNFNVTDADGVGNINDTSASVRFERGGEVTRVNNSCVWVADHAPNTATYSCSVGLWYFDGSGAWTINVSARDINGTEARNASTTFTYNQLTAMVMSPTALGWNTLSLTDVNVGSNNDPIVVNNTGNDDGLAIQVTAYDLQGEIVSTDYIYAGNFSVGIVSEGCAGDLMSNGSGVVISGSVLGRGNNSLGQGQEDVYFCLKGLPANIAAQDYSSSGIGAWDIRIVLVVLTAGKRKKKEKKELKNDRLVSAMGLIADELKEKYSLSSAEVVEALTGELMEKFGVSVSEISALRLESKMEIPLKVFAGGELGALEAVVKYMKENLGMKYSEIGEKLGRDQRTVWTAYKKGCGKSDVIMKFEEGEDSVPLDIFADDRLTVLESIVVYLKRDKKMRYSDIGEILGRDQRNVWGVCARAEKKIEEKR